MTEKAPAADLDAAGKDRHDLAEAVTTLERAVADLAQGYRFDDKWAALKIQTLQRAVAIVTKALAPQLKK